MPNGKMDAIQIQDAVVAQKWSLSPRFILLGQGLVETAHRAGGGCNSHQFFSNFSHFMRACATDEHFCQCFSHLGFIPAISLKDLGMKLSLPISGHGKILNAPGGSDQVTAVGPIAIASAVGCAFAPGGSDALLQFFTHDLFD